MARRAALLFGLLALAGCERPTPEAPARQAPAVTANTSEAPRRAPDLRDSAREYVWEHSRAPRCLAEADVEYGSLPLLARLDSLPEGARGDCPRQGDLNNCRFTMPDGLTYTLYNNLVWRKALESLDPPPPTPLPLGLNPRTDYGAYTSELRRRGLPYELRANSTVIDVSLCSIAGAFRVEMGSDARPKALRWMVDFPLRCEPTERLQFGRLPIGGELGALPPPGAVVDDPCTPGEGCGFTLDGVQYGYFDKEMGEATLELSRYTGPPLPLGLNAGFDRARVAATLTRNNIPWTIDGADLDVALCGGDPLGFITFRFDRLGRLHSITYQRQLT